MSHAGHSLLDEAYGLWLSDDADAALRLAIALLEADPLDLSSAMLLVDVLLDRDRTLLAGEAAVRLVDSFTRRGDLPGAVVACERAGRSGENGQALLMTVAETFGKGSDRVGDVSASPPPIPRNVEPDKVLSRTSGEKLVDRAEEALRGYMATDDPVPRDGKVPRLPLIGVLEPRALGELLQVLEVRDAADAEDVIVQGEEGREAFIVVRGMVQALRRGEDGADVTLAALGPGSIFGEMALVSDAPRAASVVALEPTRLLVARSKDLEQLARSEPVVGSQLGEFCRSRMVANLIRHSAILGAVAPEARADLMALFETRTFEPGEALLEQDRETEGLFLIASGGVEVTGTDEDGDRLRIAELGPGDVVGEISLVLRRPATADVLATHATIALQLTRDKFHQAIKDHPTLLSELYELATKREEETRTVVAQEAVDLGDIVLV